MSIIARSTQEVGEKTKKDLRPILIFGKRGQLGSELLKNLNLLCPVIGLDRTEVDLCSEKDIKKAIATICPRAVINAAAYTQVDLAEKERNLAFAINAHAPKVMADACAQLGTPLVHYSTDYVFNGLSERAWLETDIPAPLNVYGQSKLEGERMLQESKADCIIFRTSWVYSLYGKNFLLSILKLAKEKKELSVVDDQIGCPTWAGSLALSTQQLFKSCYNEEDAFFKKHRGLYHLVGQGHCSWHTFACAILDCVHQKYPDYVSLLKAQDLKKISSADYVMPAKRPLYSVLNTKKAELELGLKLPSWDDQLNQCMQTFKD